MARRLYRDKVTGKTAVYPESVAALFPNLEPATEQPCSDCTFIPEKITEPATDETPIDEVYSPVESDIMGVDKEGAIDYGDEH